MFFIREVCYFYEPCITSFSKSTLNGKTPTQHCQKSWTFRVRDKLSAASLFQNGGQKQSHSRKTFPLRYLK